MEMRKVAHGISPVPYSTYNHQACYGIILAQNPSIYNWQLNEVMQFRCSRSFLLGDFSSPDLKMHRGFFKSCPFIEIYEMPYRFLGSRLHEIIRRMLALGYGVAFQDCDDYYIKGKTWYKSRHFAHDGLICGYDLDRKTYLLYAYDKDWKLSLFETPMYSIGNAARGGEALGKTPMFYPIKAKDDKVVFSPERVYLGLKEYIESDMKKYPLDGKGMVYGFAAQEYLLIYLEKLASKEIEHGKADRRIFRLFMEHKVFMLERIKRVEEDLRLGNDASRAYADIADKARHIHIMYAMYIAGKREETPGRLISLIRTLIDTEKAILNNLLEEMKGKILK